ncbi:MAG: hypothetical protein PHU07_05430 [Acidocella sp.]|nr:hypothetical protein [Acidocella sp.]
MTGTIHTKIESERGQFWLAGDIEQVGAASAMQGSLTTNEDGGVTINLDMAEWTWRRADKPFPSFMTDKFDVAGFLPAQNLYVWLQDAQLRSLPGLSTGGGTKLGSYVTLFSTSPVSGQGISSCIKRLMIPLGGLWPWLDRPMPKTSLTDTRIETHYPLDINDEFELRNGSVTVRTGTSIPQDFGTRTISVKQQGWLDFEFETPISLAEAKDIYLHIEDFFVLLTDEEYGLDWPEIQLSESEGTGHICVFRRRPQKSEISTFMLWIQYPSISENFGELVDDWLDMRTKYGAAFHLYLGVRRGKSVYVEHRFANLMWGLEAFHRKAKPNSLILSNDAEEKIKKVCEATKEILNSKERRELRLSMRYRHEKRLSEKLYDLFSELSLCIPDEELKQFTKKCADRRNDISHYGGPRNESDYDEFIREIIDLMGALDQLYHASILKQIGISDNLIHHIFYKSFKSAGIREQLKLAGLNLPQPPLPLPPRLQDSI